MSRILLVEDSPDLAEGLQRNLEMDGYEVSLAMKGAHALALATSDKPDLIVLDLGLPDRDGYSVLEQLRERGNDVPVLILSARQEEADKVKGFRLGADDYVTKPFGVLELLARVAALLRRARAVPAALAAAGAGAAASPGEPGVPAGPDDDELRVRFGLTARQVTVARLLEQGCTNVEIAERLQVSAFTARNHTEQVMKQLDTSKRARVGPILRGAP